MLYGRYYTGPLKKSSINETLRYLKTVTKYLNDLNVFTSFVTIIKKHTPYSYIFQLPGNSTKHIQANKTRELKTKTSNVGAIYDADIILVR